MGAFFKTSNSGLLGVIEVAAKTFDLIGAGIVTFGKTAIHNIRQIPTAIKNAFVQMANIAVDAINWTSGKIAYGLNKGIDKVNKVINGLNGVSKALGFSGIPTINKVSSAAIEHFSYKPANFTTLGEQWENPKALQTALNNAVAQSKQVTTANHHVAGSYGQIGESASGAGKKAVGASKNMKSATDEVAKSAQELGRIYDEQLQSWIKRTWELKAPFLSEAHQIEYEILYGKFKALDDDLKATLRDGAKTLDTNIANYSIQEKIRQNYQSSELLFFGDSAIARLSMELSDKANELHLASDKFKQELMTSTLQLEFDEITVELGRQNRELTNQLTLLGTKNELSHTILANQMEQNERLAVYDGLLQKGVLLQKEYDELKQRFDYTRSLKDQVAIQTSYNALIGELKTEDEKRSEKLQEQLSIINQMNIATGDMLDMERAKRLISDAVGLPKPRTDHYAELEDTLAKQYATVNAGVKSLLENERLTEQERIDLKQWASNEKIKIEQNYLQAQRDLMLSDSESLFGSLASIAKDELGEQSRVYRAMFAVQQGFAIAQAGIAMHQAISQGLAKGFPMGLADMAMAAAQGAKIVSAIKSVVMPVGQAHDGIMSVPKSGTWNLEKGERVLPKHTAQNLDRTLSNLQGSGGNSVIVNQHITINADGTNDVKQDSQTAIGKALETGMRQIIIKELRQGGVISNAIKGR